MESSGRCCVVGFPSPNQTPDPFFKAGTLRAAWCASSLLHNSRFAPRAAFVQVYPSNEPIASFKV